MNYLTVFLASKGVEFRGKESGDVAGNYGETEGSSSSVGVKGEF